MKTARAVFFVLLAGCGSSFATEMASTEADAGDGEDAGTGTNDASAPMDATTTTRDDAGEAEDAASPNDAAVVTTDADSAADAGPWTSLAFPGPGAGGIAVANEQLYYAGTDGVYGCTLPMCASFSLTFAGLPATALTANATATSGQLAWLSGDASVIDFTDSTGAKMAYAAAAIAGTDRLDPIFAADGTMLIFDRSIASSSYAGTGLGDAVNPNNDAFVYQNLTSLLVARSRGNIFAGAGYGGAPPTAVNFLAGVASSNGAQWETNGSVVVCPSTDSCASIDALAAGAADAVVYAALSEGTSDAIATVSQTGTIQIVATGLPSPIDKMYKYANGLVWTSGRSLYGCTNAVTACTGGLIGTASSPFDAITSDDAYIYLEEPQAPGVIERFAVPHS